ncbi:MAG: hypothetical protein EXS67_03410 [Candidatus Margulisbacteria bacterium]|nr:hypothetical protein [Candidatus Margulisiibacteriota bacterium]
MKLYFRGVVVALFFLFSGSIFSENQDGWHLSTFMGGSMSLPNRLKIDFADLPDQSINTHIDNKSFSDSHWWICRLEDWHGEDGQGFELIHHKVYLANTTDLVQHFGVCDGYNLLYYNFGKRFGEDRFRFGLGLAFPHPNIKIAGRETFFKEGLAGKYLGGPTFQLDYEHVMWDNDLYFVSMDTKLTLSYIRIPVSNNRKEYADVPDIAIHFGFGFGSKPKAFNQEGLGKALYFAPLVYPYLTGTYVLGTGLVPAGSHEEE